MPSYHRYNEIWHRQTFFIDKIGLGMIDRRITVSLISAFSDERDSVICALALEDPANPFEKTYIKINLPQYDEWVNIMTFSLTIHQRDQLIRLLAEKQFYDMTGWDYCMASIRRECALRGMKYDVLTMPDYTHLPVREDGFRTRGEKWFCAELGELDTMDTSPVVDIEDGLYVTVSPPRSVPAVGYYFKVMKMDMTDPEAFFEDRDVLSWCRISMERPAYITGYDECMTLSDEQIDKMIAGLQKKYDGEHTIWQKFLVRAIVNDCDVTGEVCGIDMNLPMPDYTQLYGGTTTC